MWTGIAILFVCLLLMFALGNVGSMEVALWLVVLAAWIGGYFVVRLRRR